MDFDTIRDGNYIAKEEKVDDEDMAEAEDEYVVEEILKKRVRGGVIEYFLKWQGFSMEDCTWEPKENLTCSELIEQFEANLLDKKPKREKKRNDSGDYLPETNGHGSTYTPSFSSIGKKEDPDPFSANPNNEPAEVVEVGKRGNDLSYRVRWQGSGGSDWISAKIANQRMPHIVLRYYQDLASGKDQQF